LNLRLDEIAAEGAESVVKKMIEAAEGGDRAAARIVLNRLWSAPKTRAVEIDLPDVHDAEDVVAANAAIVRAMADGRLTPEEGAAFCTVLDSQRQAIAQHDHERRLQALEQKMDKEMENIGRLDGERFGR
jgi:hypothetical protein